VAARKALVQLLEPLVGFVLDCGLSTKSSLDFTRGGVRSVAAKQLSAERRINISGLRHPLVFHAQKYREYSGPHARDAASY